MTNVDHPNATVPDSVEVPRVGALRYELGWQAGVRQPLYSARYNAAPAVASKHPTTA